jgi:protein-S-isoprenylcysteine O-methyltransferase Ste14
MSIQSRNESSSETASTTLKNLNWGSSLFILLCLHGGILFLSSGQLDWPMAWVYLVVFAACVLYMGRYLARSKPGLLVERAKIAPQQDVAPWDKLVSTLIRISMLLMLLVSGLDRRFGWTGQVLPGERIPFIVQLLALVGGFLGYLLILWALASNDFAATYVRIQDDRGHAVVTSGPYRYVRHPFYVGVITFVFAAPLALGSLWALLVGAFITSLFVLRTGLEDRKLTDELDGYRQYAAQVRYRLLPGVW